MKRSILDSAVGSEIPDLRVLDRLIPPSTNPRTSQQRPIRSVPPSSDLTGPYLPAAPRAAPVWP